MGEGSATHQCVAHVLLETKVFFTQAASFSYANLFLTHVLLETKVCLLAIFVLFLRASNERSFNTTRKGRYYLNTAKLVKFTEKPSDSAESNKTLVPASDPASDPKLLRATSLLFYYILFGILRLDLYR